MVSAVVCAYLLELSCTKIKQARHFNLSTELCKVGVQKSAHIIQVFKLRLPEIRSFEETVLGLW